MYSTRQNSKNKKLSNNIIKNITPKTLQLLTTNNIIKKQNNINSFIPFSLLKSKSLVPFSTNTSRNQKLNNLKQSFENLFNQKSLRNSNTKNQSLINTLLKPKSNSKPKSIQKRGTSSKKPKINNMKNSSYLSNNELIKNILLFRKKNKNKNKNKNNIIKNKNNKSQSNNYNININNSKSRSNSIRCSLTYVNRHSYIHKPEKPRIKYDDCINITNNGYNKLSKLLEKDKHKYKNKKWADIHDKLENLKIKTNYLLNKYYFLTENLYNELELINSNYAKNNFINNKSYDYMKKNLIYDKNDEEQTVNEFIGNRYINTDINHN